MRRLGFGPLWAINAETLAPGQGIPLHAHERMEIITIPLAGSLRHVDSRGIRHILVPGDIHMLSAGRGITHWEFNNSGTEPARYLQVWMESSSLNTPVRYEQGSLRGGAPGRFALIAASASRDAIVNIDQQAFVSLGSIDKHLPLRYRMYDPANALYCFAAEGEIHVGDLVLSGDRGMEMPEGHSLDFTALQPATVLGIEVPRTPI